MRDLSEFTTSPLWSVLLPDLPDEQVRAAGEAVAHALDQSVP